MGENLKFLLGLGLAVSAHAFDVDDDWRTVTQAPDRAVLASDLSRAPLERDDGFVIATVEKGGLKLQAYFNGEENFRRRKIHHIEYEAEGQRYFVEPEANDWVRYQGSYSTRKNLEYLRIDPYSRGSDVQKQLIRAAREGDSIPQELLNMRSLEPRDYYLALKNAVEAGNGRMFDVLWTHPEGKEILGQYRFNPNCVFGTQTFLEAAMTTGFRPENHFDHWVTIRKSLEIGANPNDPFFMGAHALQSILKSSTFPEKTKTFVVEVLLEYKADPNLLAMGVPALEKNPVPQEPSPLAMVIADKKLSSEGRLRLVDKLLKSGANPNLGGTLEAPLVLAAESKDIPEKYKQIILQSLFAYKADPEALDSKGVKIAARMLKAGFPAERYASAAARAKTPPRPLEIKDNVTAQGGHEGL